jgi:hypothetical protein
MLPLVLRDADGRACYVARRGTPPPAGMAMLGEREAAWAITRMSDTQLRRLWGWARGEPGDDACAHDVRGWARIELCGPTSRCRLWRAPAVPRRTSAPGEAQARTPVVDLRDLVPRPAPEHWAEVRIVDESGERLADVALTLVRADGSRIAARTGSDGVARWRGLCTGPTRVCFDEDEPSYAEDP